MRTLRGHVNFIHLEKSFNCSICNKSFKQERYLKEHHVSIHDDKKFECEKCDQFFNCSTSLKRHYDQHELKDNGLMIHCKLCDTKFSKRRHFTEHLGRFHKGLNIEPEIVLFKGFVNFRD